jgi:hypothetical protein
MKIVVFSYNFSHYKSTFGILNLIRSGLRPDLVLLADPVTLSLPIQAVRSVPRGLLSLHPKELCDIFGLETAIVPHASEASNFLLSKIKPDIGIILGARILPKCIIDCFSFGIINMHAGKLPDNRGLDNVQWAILHDLPQEASLHFINSQIDRGSLVSSMRINVEPDDTIFDLQLKLLNAEQELLLEFIPKLLSYTYQDIIALPKIGNGTYHSILEDIDKDRFEFKLRAYCQKWSSSSM